MNSNQTAKDCNQVNIVGRFLIQRSGKICVFIKFDRCSLFDILLCVSSSLCLHYWKY